MKQTLIKIAIATLATILLSTSASAYSGNNYRTFSGLKEMAEITADDIDQSTSLFVSPSGDDDNSGSIDAPLKTINKAIANAKCDYTIYLRAGTYNENVIIDKGHLTLRNYPGETATITGVGLDITTLANIIIRPNLTNISIYGLHIQDRQEQDIEAAYGIIAYGGSRNLIIQNNEFQNINGNPTHKWDVHGYNAGAIDIFGDQTNPVQNVLIAGNKIHDMDCGKSEAIIVSGYVNKVDIIENEINDIFNIGIDVAGHYGANSDANKDYARYVYIAGNKVTNARSDIADNGGIYVDGAKGVLVERNFVTGCPFGISVGQENDIADTNLHTEDIIVSANYITNSVKGGIRIGTAQRLSSSVLNSLIINNTILQPNTALSGALIIGKNHDNMIQNNVIHDFGTWNNLIFTDDNSTPAEIYNTILKNNYLYSTNRAGFASGYFLIAGTQYTESAFEALDYTINNYLRNPATFSTNYTSDYFTGKGADHTLRSVLRDYEGFLGTETADLGYIFTNRKTDTEEDLAKLTDVFPFSKNYIIDGASTGIVDPCAVENPVTLDSILNYVAILGAGCVAILFVKKLSRR